MNDRLLTTDEAAELLALHPQTLRRWRMQGQGPAAVKLGSAVRYRVRDLETWLDKNREASTA